MRTPSPAIWTLLALACTGCAAQTATVAPAASRLPGQTAPVIESVTFKTQPEGSDLVEPQIHFHAERGDVRFIHQDVLESTGPDFKIAGGPVDIPSAKQRAGAVYSLALRCGPTRYRVKVAAYLADRDGDRSNTVTYTLRCNGG